MSAIVRHPLIPAKLRKRLQKGQPIGRQACKEIARVAHQAIYEVPTLPCYIFNPVFEALPDKRYRWALAATIVPWTESKPEEKGTFLCCCIHKSPSELSCSIKIVHFPIGNDRRTVLVTGHVCEAIMERANIKGSAIAYIAESIVEGESTLEWQPNKVPLLPIYDLRRTQVLGYCPIVEKECGLHRGRDTFVDKKAKDYIADQPRCRLKTFLLPDYFSRTNDGCLAPKRALKRAQSNDSPPP